MRPCSVLIALLLLGAAAHCVAADPARKLSQVVKPAIVNGKDSPRVGWYVSIGLVDIDTGNWGSYCGGMLITQTVVLTAAHCVFDADQSTIRPGGTVAIGIRSLNDKSNVDFATVKRTIVHPRYQPGPGSRFVGRGFDIALLELDPATVSGKNELVALPTYVPKPRNPVAAGTRLALIGLGELGNGTDPTTLQRTDLVLERLETCNAAYANWPDLDNFLEGTYICAGPPGLNDAVVCYTITPGLSSWGRVVFISFVLFVTTPVGAPRTNKLTDACPGDSGGPLYAPRTAGRPYDTAIGLVSFGDDCDVLFNQTRYGRPGVYTNIAQLRPWVDGNLACLARGETCPWGGTCFEYPANGCASCESGLDGNPTVCATCAVAGYVVDKDVQSRQFGQCRPEDCRDLVNNCIGCARRGPFKCAACNFGYKVVNNQCVLKTCLDYVPGCQQCDPASPLTCTACKRRFALDIPTGQCVRL